MVKPASGPGTTSINSTAGSGVSFSGSISTRANTLEVHTGVYYFQQDSIAALNRVLNSAQPINGTSGVIGLINPDSIPPQDNTKIPVGGSIYVTGTNVTDKSIITTPKGETFLAAGSTVSLIDSTTPGIRVDITGAKHNATNLGTIMVEIGRTGIAGSLVRSSGQTNASSVVNEEGRLYLRAGPIIGASK